MERNRLQSIIDLFSLRGFRFWAGLAVMCIVLATIWAVGVNAIQSNRAMETVQTEQSVKDGVNSIVEKYGTLDVTYKGGGASE